MIQKSDIIKLILSILIILGLIELKEHLKFSDIFNSLSFVSFSNTILIFIIIFLYKKLKYEENHSKYLSNEIREETERILRFQTEIDKLKKKNKKLRTIFNKLRGDHKLSSNEFYKQINNAKNNKTIKAIEGIISNFNKM